MFFFIDESGTDHHESPYEVIASLNVPEASLWPFIQDLEKLQETYFGGNLSKYGVEMKGSKLLNKKVFRFASQMPLITNPAELRKHTISFLETGVKARCGGVTNTPSHIEFTAYGQSCLAFVNAVLDLVASYRLKVFAGIVDPVAPVPDKVFLRKDYNYPFQRFRFFLVGLTRKEYGIVVMDEKDKSDSRVLIQKMSGFCLQTKKGKLLADHIIPEPFFVHSDITTAIQVVDIIAYTINFGLRMANTMKNAARPELAPMATKVWDLRFRGKKTRDAGGKVFVPCGIFYLADLRPGGK